MTQMKTTLSSVKTDATSVRKTNQDVFVPKTVEPGGA